VATGKKKKKKPVRTDADYLASAKALSKLVPSLKKLASRKTLTAPYKPPKPGAKKRTREQIRKANIRIIKRREKQLQNIPFLVPVTKQQAKRLGRRKLFLPGIQAIQLRNVEEGSKITITKRGDIAVQDGPQHWIYWTLDRATVRSKPGMRAAGADAFNKQFPIEKLSDLTALAFKNYNVKQVHLWAHAGIVGTGFMDVKQFIMWVNEKWQQGRYITVRENAEKEIYSDPSDPGKWVNGIAILVENPEYTRKRKALIREEHAKTQARIKAAQNK